MVVQGSTYVDVYSITFLVKLIVNPLAILSTEREIKFNKRQNLIMCYKVQYKLRFLLNCVFIPGTLKNECRENHKTKTIL